MSRVAIVTGAAGRVGSAFHARLVRDGFDVYPVEVDQQDDVIHLPVDAPLYLFECAYRHGGEAEHVAAVCNATRSWNQYAGIFIPSSLWIGTDSPYGRAKLIVEQLAAFYRSIGANIVTDRIGYFPGDGVEPDPTDPFFDRLVTGDELYNRVMEKLL